MVRPRLEGRVRLSVSTGVFLPIGGSHCVMMGNRVNGVLIGPSLGGFDVGRVRDLGLPSFDDPIGSVGLGEEVGGGRSQGPGGAVVCQRFRPCRLSRLGLYAGSFAATLWTWRSSQKRTWSWSSIVAPKRMKGSLSHSTS